MTQVGFELATSALGVRTHVSVGFELATSAFEAASELATSAFEAASKPTTLAELLENYCAVLWGYVFSLCATGSPLPGLVFAGGGVHAKGLNF